MSKRIVTARDQVELLAAWRKTAEPTEFNYVWDTHIPHGWEEHPLWTKDQLTGPHVHIIPPGMRKALTYDWHPHYGESHVRYELDPQFAEKGNKLIGYKVHHKGVFLGTQMIDIDEDGELWPHHKYTNNGGRNDYILGDFPTAEEAKAAAEKHFQEKYGAGGSHRPDEQYYDDALNNIDEHTEPNQPPKFNDDYGDIFGDREARLAVRDFNFGSDPHLPHDWEEVNLTADGTKRKVPGIHEWHPPHGESHVAYWVRSPASPDSGFGYSLHHEGFYHGPNEGGLPKYHLEDDGSPLSVLNGDPSSGGLGTFHLGLYDTLEQAKAAAAEHFERNYASRAKPGADYYDNALRQMDDEDYGDIFGDREASLRIASLFDWRSSPEYQAPGITLNHYSAPLENGDRLHVYQPNWQGRADSKPWVFELEPHDMPSRLPLRWHTHCAPDLVGGVMPMLIARDPQVDPPGTDRSRRNLSIWGRDKRPDGKYENGSMYRSREEAMAAAEKRYLEEAPGWGQRAPHQREELAVDYDDHFKPGDLDDDYGDIFGKEGALKTAGWATWHKTDPNTPCPICPDNVPHPNRLLHVAPLENGHELHAWSYDDNLWPELAKTMKVPGTPETYGWSWAIVDPSDGAVGHGDLDYELAGNGGDAGDFDDPHHSNFIPTLDQAKAEAEAHYQRMFPLGTDTGPHNSGVNYDDIVKNYRDYL